jgi:hypothetical protein
MTTITDTLVARTDVGAAALAALERFTEIGRKAQELLALG